MSKDKIIGAIVIILGILIAVVYTLGSVVDLIWEEAFPATHGVDLTSSWLSGIDLFNWRYFVVGPMWLVVILIAIIAIWIGYSMLTTPAPVPLEELEEELAAEEEEISKEED
jgi:membrane-associated phospholipid phosphatase